MAQNDYNKLVFTVSDEINEKLNDSLFDCYPLLKKNRIVIRPLHLYRYLIRLGLTHFSKEDFVQFMAEQKAEADKLAER